MDFSGRTILITGAARGTGAATARTALKVGAQVVGLDQSWGKLGDYYTDVRQFREELEGFGDRFLPIEADITKDEDMDRAYAQTMDRFGRVDAIINNAALLQHHIFKPTGRTRVLDTSDADWERMLAVNVIGVLKVVRRFVQPMIVQRKGAIINIVSSGIIEKTYRPWSMEQPYMATKAAVANMSWYLADELREFNISVNSVSPGHGEMTGWEVVDEERAKANLPVPSSRQVPEHLVPLMLFLASHDATDGPTGTYIDVAEWNLAHGYGNAESWKRENVTAEKLQSVEA